MTIDELYKLLDTSFDKAAERLGLMAVVDDGSTMTDDMLMAITRWAHLDDPGHARSDVRAMQNWLRVLGAGCTEASQALSVMRRTVRDDDGEDDLESVYDALPADGSTILRAAIVQWTELPEDEVDPILTKLMEQGRAEWVPHSMFMWRRTEK